MSVYNCTYATPACNAYSIANAHTEDSLNCDRLNVTEGNIFHFTLSLRRRRITSRHLDIMVLCLP